MEFPQTGRGTTLIETMIAVLVAMIGVFGLGTLIFQATVTNKNQGTEVTRATIYAQDKMEKLLSFGAAGADTSALPVASQVANYATCTQTVNSVSACNSTITPTNPGITDAAWNTGLVSGGPAVTSGMVPSCPSSGPSVGYVDFLDINGNLLSGPCSTVALSTPAYVRMWQISDVTSGGAPMVPSMKQVTVGVWSQAAVSTSGAPKPVVVLTSYISNPN
ncbi:MAG TPA: hypothetical protein VG028_12920 [Terriglobia bacterium]|nr:hypothetical protein [Terriglobia bacterium]